MEESKTAEQMQEEKKSNRDVFLGNLRSKYPDIEDEDELYGAAMRGYDEEHDWAKSQREQNLRLSEAIGSDPQLAAFVSEIYERGKDGHPEMAFLNLGDLIKAYATGEMSSDEYLKEKERIEAERKATDEKMAKQQQLFEAWAASKGYDAEEWIARAREKLLDPMSKYEMAEAQLDALDNMLNYEEDVATAEETGRVRAANERIVEAKKRERMGDGVPHPTSGSKQDTKDNELERISKSRRYRQSLN